MSVKFTIEEQDKKTGLWTEVRSLKWRDICFVKVKKKFLFWEYTDRNYIENPRPVSEVRNEARKIAKSHFKDTENSVRITVCDEAVDEDGGHWFPDHWKRIIWKDGCWL